MSVAVPNQSLPYCLANSFRFVVIAAVFGAPDVAWKSEKAFVTVARECECILLRVLDQALQSVKRIKPLLKT